MSIIDNSTGLPSLTSSNTIRFVPGQPGDTAFLYVVTDGLRAYSTGQVSISVMPLNNPPTVMNTSFTYNVDQLNGFEIPIFDPDTVGQTLKILTAPRHGLAESGAGTTFSYRPAHGFTGPDSFDIRIVDADVFVDATIQLDCNAAPASDDATRLASYWGDRYGALNPNDDDDHDGVTNLQEYWADTSPIDKNSRLGFSSIRFNADGAILLEWDAVGGVRYRIKSADCLGPGCSFTDLTSTIEEEFDTADYHLAHKRTFIDARPVGDGALLYLIEIVQ